MRIGWNATRVAVGAATWGAFLLVGVWGIIPLAGPRTLIEILTQGDGFSPRMATVVISFVVAVLGGFSLALPFLPIVNGWQREEERRKGGRKCDF